MRRRNGPQRPDLNKQVGTLVVDERIYPISSIEMGEGKILFHVGPLAPPLDLPLASEVRVHAPDGSLVITAPWTIPDRDARNLRRMRSGDSGWIVFPLAICEVAGWPRS